jgi:hypothetical protein
MKLTVEQHQILDIANRCGVVGSHDHIG